MNLNQNDELDVRGAAFEPFADVLAACPALRCLFAAADLSGVARIVAVSTSLRSIKAEFMHSEVPGDLVSAIAHSASLKRVACTFMGVHRIADAIPLGVREVQLDSRFSSDTDALVASIVQKMDQFQIVALITYFHLLRPESLQRFADAIAAAPILQSVETHGYLPDTCIAALARAIERSPSGVEVHAYNHYPVFETARRAGEAYRAVLAVHSALIARGGNAATPLARFLRRDGDTAVMHRVLGMLV